MVLHENSAQNRTNVPVMYVHMFRAFVAHAIVTRKDVTRAIVSDCARDRGATHPDHFHVFRDIDRDCAMGETLGPVARAKIGAPETILCLATTDQLTHDTQTLALAGAYEIHLADLALCHHTVNAFGASS